MKWSQLYALALRLKAWIQREIVEDDPWDVETLFPPPEQESIQSNASERKLPNGSSESVPENTLDAKSSANPNRSHD